MNSLSLRRSEIFIAPCSSGSDAPQEAILFAPCRAEKEPTAVVYKYLVPNGTWETDYVVRINDRILTSQLGRHPGAHRAACVAGFYLDRNRDRDCFAARNPDYPA